MVHLGSTSLNKARVAQRVEEGGHDVPDEKIEARIPRLLRLVKSVIPVCDHAYLLDNSLADNPLVRVLTMHHGQVEKTLGGLSYFPYTKNIDIIYNHRKINSGRR